MMNKFFKILSYLLLLIISPMILVVIAGAIYIGVQMVNGNSFSAGIQGLVGIFNQVQPYLPYLTGIPAVLVVAGVVIHKVSRTRRQISKE